MRRNLARKRWWPLVVLALVLGLSVLAAGCGGDDEEAAPPPAEPAAPPPAEPTPPPAEPTPPPAEAGALTQQPGQCGAPDAQGQEATGEPIKIGGIEMDIPGVVFSAILNLTRGYFECLNDNGGIGGRPVEYIKINDQGDGNASHAAAVKLWEDEGVLGFAGNTSFVDCTVNHEYYEQNGIYPIVAGASAECFNTPNIAAVNQGPLYSVAAATNFALEERNATKIVCLRANTPGSELQCLGAGVLAKLKGAKFVEHAIDVPIADPASLVTQSAQEAGETGAVLPGFTEDQLLPFMQAVEQQGLMDKALWYAGATGSTSSFLQGLSDEWDGRWFAQSEFSIPEFGDGPDMVLYRSIVEQYEPDEPFGNFGEMGFLAGRFMAEALFRVLASGDELTQETVNAAVQGLVNIETDVLCKPWYFGDLPTHLPNNASLYVTREKGKAVPVAGESCVANPLTDPIIAQAYLDEEALGIPPVAGQPTTAEIEEFLATNK